MVVVAVAMVVVKAEAQAAAKVEAARQVQVLVVVAVAVAAVVAQAANNARQAARHARSRPPPHQAHVRAPVVQPAGNRGRPPSCNGEGACIYYCWSSWSPRGRAA